MQYRFRFVWLLLRQVTSTVGWRGRKILTIEVNAFKTSDEVKIGVTGEEIVICGQSVS
jgi:hypothetical protein